MKPIATAVLFSPNSGGGIIPPPIIAGPVCRVTRFICFAALALLSGCFTTGPTDNLGFADIEQLSDLDGVYQNRGEPESAQLWLSQIVWPDVDGLFHGGIDRIEVRVADAQSLEVTAMDASSTVVRRDIFVEGVDFKLSSGVLQLGHNVHAPPNVEAAFHYAGLAYEDVNLGLDKAGHGKYQSKGVTAGVALMFIPIAAGGSDEVRFRRISE